MANFPKQLALSALVMGGVIGGLFALGRGAGEAADRGVRPASSGARALEPTAAGPNPGPADARALLPARSWLVVDFDGHLTGTSPFPSAAGACASVPPPVRVGLAIVGGSPGAQTTAPSDARGDESGAALLLVSPAVSPEFWQCVRAEVLTAGGHALSASAGEESLESPSGVLVYSAGRLLFSTNRSLLGELVELTRGKAPSAASTAPHSTLASTVPQARAEAHADALLATLSLPPDWLSDIGPEASATPLRHLTAGAIRTDADGGALGALECAEPGCEELTGFLLRARSDLGGVLPSPLGEATARSWRASRERLSPTRGLIRLRWVPEGTSFSDWVSGVWQVLSRRGAETTLPPPPRAPPPPVAPRSPSPAPEP